eukprot:8609812-Alexandrium_andersonii.AAC.1
MSASLVGSEMCIRDRGEVRWTPSGRYCCWILQPRATAPAAQAARAVSVSYTHLTLPTICSV